MTHPITPDLLRDMKRYTDRVVGERYGIPTATIGHIRRRQGILRHGQYRVCLNRPGLGHNILLLLTQHPEGVLQRDLPTTYSVSRQAIHQALASLERYRLVRWEWAPVPATRLQGGTCPKRWYAVVQEETPHAL